MFLSHDAVAIGSKCVRSAEKRPGARTGGSNMTSQFFRTGEMFHLSAEDTGGGCGPVFGGRQAPHL